MATGLDSGDVVKRSDTFSFFRGNKTDKSAGRRDVQIEQLIALLNDPDVLNNVGSGGTPTFVSVTNDYIVPATGDDYVLLIDSTGGPIDVTLPTAVQNQKIALLSIAAITSPNIITIVGSLDGQTNPTIEKSYSARSLLGSSSAWKTVASFDDFFTYDAANDFIETLSTISIATSSEDFSSGTGDFSNAGANVDQDPLGWRNDTVTSDTVPTLQPFVQGTNLWDLGAYIGGDALALFNQTGNCRPTGLEQDIAVIDLGSAMEITQLQIVHTNASDEHVWELEGSNDWNGTTGTFATIASPTTGSGTVTANSTDSTPYRYVKLRFLFRNGAGSLPGNGQCNQVLVSAVTGYATTDNTFQDRVLTGGSLTSFATSSIVLTDESSTPLNDGDVNIEYSINDGSTWSAQYGLDAFKALGTIAGSSFWLRYQLVGAATMLTAAISTPSTGAELGSSGLSTMENGLTSNEVASSFARFKTLLEADGGIDFDGSSVLDDYEEGTWTATLPNGGVLTVLSAIYTKTGRVVNFQCYLADISPTADTSSFLIGGLPTPSSSVSNIHSAVTIGYCGDSSLATWGGVIAPNSDAFYFHRKDGFEALQTNNDYIAAASGVTDRIIVQGSYITD